MNHVTDNEALRLSIDPVRREGRSIGFVPTMGALHDGHLSLIRQCSERSSFVVVSIYVNPTQFGANEDLARYPRSMEADLDLCRAAGVDLLFAPASLYESDASVLVNESVIAQTLCGADRPGHFSGVLTVVAKLFNLVQPNVAVFGEKDAQQLMLIRRMTRDLNFPVNILGGAIVRDSDGLALSSRNQLLSTSERARALSLHRSLGLAAERFKAGERDADVIKQAVADGLDLDPVDSVDYICCVSEEDWTMPQALGEEVRLCVAVRVGRTRLIDNVRLGACP